METTPKISRPQFDRVCEAVGGIHIVNTRKTESGHQQPKEHKIALKDAFGNILRLRLIKGKVIITSEINVQRRMLGQLPTLVGKIFKHYICPHLLNDQTEITHTSERFPRRQQTNIIVQTGAKRTPDKKDAERKAQELIRGCEQCLLQKLCQPKAVAVPFELHAHRYVPGIEISMPKDIPLFEKEP
jgi:hypothetical protein